MNSKQQKEARKIIQTLRDNLRILRTAKGWTQREFAERLGVHRVTITRIESGPHVPDFVFSCQMADELGVDLGILRKNLAQAVNVAGRGKR